VVLAAAGCGGTLDPPSLVTKLRVLAVRAQPADVLPGQMTTLDALVVGLADQVDGGADPGALDYLWLACLPPPGSSDVKDCAAAAGSLIASGSGLQACAQNPGAAVCLLGTEAQVQYQPASDAAAGNVFITMVVATVASEGAVACVRRVAGPPAASPGDSCVISLKTLKVQAAAAEINTNPAVSTFTVGPLPAGATDIHTDPPLVFKLKTKLSLQPIYQPAVASELKPNGTREVLTFSWFATHKNFDHFHSGYAVDASGTVTERDDNTWTDDGDVPGLVFFWLVVRDDRGGVGWTDGRLASMPP